MSAMEITNFGHFTCSNPDAMGVIFYANEDGLDWYEMRHALTEWEEATGAFVNAVYGAWAMVGPDGVITNVEQDPSRLVPHDKTVLGIDARHTDIKPGMIYREGKLE
jgi:hypothetical protein